MQKGIICISIIMLFGIAIVLKCYLFYLRLLFDLKVERYLNSGDFSDRMVLPHLNQDVEVSDSIND